MALQHPRPDTTPTLGRIVIFQNHAYPGVPMAALVAAVPDVWSEMADLPEAGHLHLIVFDLGLHGGTRPEYNVPEDDHADGIYTKPVQTPRTWRWPAR